MFDVHVEQEGALATLVLKGELDLAEAPRLGSAASRVIRDDSVERVVVDLRGLTFMDSTGLRTILRADARAREAQKDFALIRGTERVHRIFQLTKLDARFAFTEASPASDGQLKESDA